MATQQPLDPASWQRIEELFQQVNSLPPQQRDEFLRKACNGDETLQREVESLLAVNQEADAFFERSGQPIPAMPSPSIQSSNEKAIVIGQWRTSDTPIRRSLFFRLAIIAFGLVVLLYVVTGWISLKYCCSDKGIYLWQYRAGQLFVIDVDPKTLSFGRLQVGDQILAINGDSNFIYTEPFVAERRFRAGEPIRFLVRRNNVEQLVEVSSAHQPYWRFDKVQYNILGYPRGFIFLAIACLLILLRREDHFAQIAFLSFLSLATMNLYQVIIPIQGDLTPPEQWVEAIILLLNGGDIFIPLGFALSLNFPPGVNVPPRGGWRGLQKLLWGMTAILALNMSTLVATYHNIAVADWLFAHQYRVWFRPVKNVAEMYFVFGTICISLALIRNFILVKAPQQRRRIKLVIYGSLAAILPAIILTLTEQVIHWMSWDSLSWRREYDFMLLVVNAFTLVMPLAWGYAMLTQRVYDVRVVVRRSLQYLLARNAISVVLFLPVVILLVRIISQPDLTVRQVFFSQPLTIFLIVVGALSLRFRLRLRAWLDRRFFREQYQQEQVLYRLISEISAFDDWLAPCHRVAQVLTETFFPSHVTFLFRRLPSRDLQSIETDHQPNRLLFLSETAALYQLLRKSSEPLAVPLARTFALPEPEEKELAEWQAGLLIPLHDSQMQLIGVLVLGDNRSEEPYSPDDRRLLAAIAKQIANVYEVTHLRGQVSQKSQTEHTVLARLVAENINLLRECVQCGSCYDVDVTDCAACQTPLTLTLPIERAIESRYRLEQRIGQGGMGTVYRATDMNLRRDVAIKIIKAEYFGDSKLLLRFEREAQAAARLAHPNIVKVYDFGRTQAGGAWLVMELVQGVTLRDEIKSKQKLPIQFVSQLFMQLMEGVAAAHENGVIHRDLKPDNILLSYNSDGRLEAKILDFGLAMIRHNKTLSTGHTTLTQAGLLLGTPGYMAPELLLGQQADERADLFALGVILVESLSGVKLFASPNHGDRLRDFLVSDVELPAEVMNIPQLSQLLHKCLSKDINARYQNITEMRAALTTVISH